jgi:2'-phosphotransferase
MSTKKQRRREDWLSHALTRTLRHSPIVVVRSDGYVEVLEVLELPDFATDGFSVEEVESVVARDNKGRFSLQFRDGRLLIRANQGHTIPTVSDAELLERIADGADIPVCVHGTSLRAWSDILETGGLSRMSRNHIHFAPGLPGAAEVVSGFRAGCEVAIFVDARKAMATDGIVFFKSANNVILTTGNSDGIITLRYIRRVVRLSHDDHNHHHLWPGPPTARIPRLISALFDPTGEKRRRLYLL